MFNNHELLKNWNKFDSMDKFKHLDRLENIESFAAKSIQAYLQNHSTHEIFYSLSQDKYGIEILDKYQSMTDDVMDISAIHDSNHFWNHNYETILIDLFSKSEKWFCKIYDPKTKLEISDLKKEHKFKKRI